METSPSIVSQTGVLDATLNGSQAKQPGPVAQPCFHIAILNAVQLSHWALKPLPTQRKAPGSSWQICLDKLHHLPGLATGSDGTSPPYICLLPPKAATLQPEIATALNPQRLQRQGLLPVHLAEYSETALLLALQKGIEHFFPNAFLPDPNALLGQKYLESLYTETSKQEPGQHSQQNPKKSNARPMLEEYLALHTGGESVCAREIHCYWLEGDAPLLSLELSRKLHKMHHRSGAELSFSDIFPEGLVPLLFQASILGRLHQLSEAASGQSLAGPLQIAGREPNLFATELLNPESPPHPEIPAPVLRAQSKRQFQTIQKLCCSVFSPSSEKTGEALSNEAPASIETGKNTKTVQNTVETPKILKIRGNSSSVATQIQNPNSTESYAGMLPKILKWIKRLPRSLPTYFQVQISAFCPQRCAHCPYPQIAGPRFFPPFSSPTPGPQDKHGKNAITATHKENGANGLPQTTKESEAFFMQRRLWRELLTAIVHFTEDAHIGLSPLGEALLHPEFVPFIEDLLRFPSLKLLIETSGAAWKAEDIRHLARRGRGRITWIISLDALNAQLYQKLRAPHEEIITELGMTPSQHKAHELVRLLRHSECVDSVYVQAVRTTENDRDLENFYRHWSQPPQKEPIPISPKEQKPKATISGNSPVIIQKYNSYAGRLPERRPLRLKPEHRIPCRRLEREMIFGLEGQCYVCVQDLERKLTSSLGLKTELGRFPEKSLEKLWQATEALYEQHRCGQYSGLCAQCDEYYVCNF